MLRVMNSNFKIIDTLKKYTFAQYEDKFREIGTFKVLAQLVKENNYLFDKKEQYYILFDEFTVGKVEKVVKDSDSEYDKTITIVGRLAPVLLTQRVINSIVDFTGSSVDYIVTLLQMCFDLDNIDSSRYIYMNVVTDDVSENKELSSIRKQVTGGYLWDEIKETMELDDLGLFFYPKLTSVYSDRLDIETNVKFWTLMLSSGTDRRVKNKEGNEAIIFSQSLSNISRTAYTKDSESYKNVAYVAGEGEGTDRKWYELKINQENAIGEQIGWNRSELWIDARDLQSEDADGNKLTQEQYETNIKNRANEKAKENNVSHAYESTVTVRNLEYRKDFDKGDWVTIKDDELGIIIDAQIIAAIVTEQDSKRIVDVTLQYGKIKKDTVTQIKDGFKKLEQIETNIKYLNDATRNTARDYSFSGTYVTNVSGSSQKIFGLDWLREQFKKRFGIESGTDSTRYIVTVANGDGLANPVHIDGVTYQKNSWYAVFDRDIKTATKTRINYRVVVCLGDSFQVD